MLSKIIEVGRLQTIKGALLSFLLCNSALHSAVSSSSGLSTLLSWESIFSRETQTLQPAIGVAPGLEYTFTSAQGTFTISQTSLELFPKLQALVQAIRGTNNLVISLGEEHCIYAQAVTLLVKINKIANDQSNTGKEKSKIDTIIAILQLPEQGLEKESPKFNEKLHRKTKHIEELLRIIDNGECAISEIGITTIITLYLCYANSINQPADIQRFLPLLSANLQLKLRKLYYLRKKTMLDNASSSNAQAPPPASANNGKEPDRGEANINPGFSIQELFDYEFPLQTDGGEVLNLQGQHIEDVKPLSLVSIPWYGYAIHPIRHLRSKLILNMITSLDLKRNKLRYLGSEIFDALVQLQVLCLAENCISGLHEDCFRGLEQLTDIDLSHNQLLALPKTLFTNNIFLKKISLNNNKLASIPEGIFCRLRVLEDLNLATNLITTFSEKTFHSLFLLRKLILSHNKLTELSESIFSDQTSHPSSTVQGSLEELYLDNNEIAALYRDVFKALKKLQILFLDHNNLTRLDASVFRDLSSLCFLRLNDNKIEQLPVGLFAGFKGNIRHLCLDRNRLRELPGGIFNDIFLSEWFITSSMEDNSEGHRPSLFLNDNQLTSLPDNIFLNCPVRRIYLFKNQLANLPPRAFANMDLISLNLDSNPLSTMPADTFLSSRIKKLHLAHCQFSDLGQPAFKIHDIKEIYLNNNRLCSLPVHFFSGMPSLEKILLNNNTINELDDSIFCDFRSRILPFGLWSLQELDLSNNRLRTLPASANYLIHFYALKRLRANGNPITESRIVNTSREVVCVPSTPPNTSNGDPACSSNEPK